MVELIDQLESELRRAVAGRRYGEVQRLIPLFCEAAANEWTRQDVSRARQVFERLQSVLGWTGAMLCVAHASTADELRHLALVNRYIRRDHPIRGNLHFEV